MGLNKTISANKLVNLTTSRSLSGNKSRVAIHSLMNRIKKNEAKEKKKNYIYLGVSLGVIIIGGLMVSL